jgi:hypothetical protein
MSSKFSSKSMILKDFSNSYSASIILCRISAHQGGSHVLDILFPGRLQFFKSFKGRSYTHLASEYKGFAYNSRLTNLLLKCKN